jgi:acyl carrier protein
MISRNQVDAIIFAALEALNDEREPGDRIEISPATPLFGVDAVIDSLGFVSVITDVESALNLDYGLDVSLADDRAMSRPESPYATVATLGEYVMELLAEPS